MYNANDQRISSTNYTWTDKILEDRKTKPENGKYIVFGGTGHFTVYMNANGYVDEQLGLPVIAHDNRDKNIGTPILQSNFPNDVDFYLPAGHCYPDIKKHIQSAYLSDMAEKYKDFPITEKISTLASQFSKEFYASIQLECHEAPASDIKTPPHITIPPPHGLNNKQKI